MSQTGIVARFVEKRRGLHVFRPLEVVPASQRDEDVPAWRIGDAGSLRRNVELGRVGYFIAARRSEAFRQTEIVGEQHVVKDR